jgi:hypothetical protein
MRVIENKNMFADLTRMRVESTRMRVVRKNNYYKKNKKHGAGACKSKDYLPWSQDKTLSQKIDLVYQF